MGNGAEGPPSAPPRWNPATVLFDGLASVYHAAAFTLGGLIAGECSFIVTTKKPPFKDGTPRLRFVFDLKMADRDTPIVAATRVAIGAGSLRRSEPRRAEWLPTVALTINSLHAHKTRTIPFCERYLPPTAKRREFELWRDALYAFDRMHPNRYGKGPSTCSVPDCPFPVRGRGLCRKHYYRATGH